MPEFGFLEIRDPEFDAENELQFRIYDESTWVQREEVEKLHTFLGELLGKAATKRHDDKIVAALQDIAEACAAGLRLMTNRLPSLNLNASQGSVSLVQLMIQLNGMKLLWILDSANAAELSSNTRRILLNSQKTILMCFLSAR